MKNPAAIDCNARARRFNTVRSDSTNEDRGGLHLADIGVVIAGLEIRRVEGYLVAAQNFLKLRPHPENIKSLRKKGPRTQICASGTAHTRQRHTGHACAHACHTVSWPASERSFRSTNFCSLHYAAVTCVSVSLRCHTRCGGCTKTRQSYQHRCLGRIDSSRRGVGSERYESAFEWTL